MKMSKKLLSVLMCLAMLAGMLAMGGTFAFAENGDLFKVGDTFYYGSYPQTEVTATLGSTLNSLSGAAYAASSSTWTSYDYTCTDGNKDSMKYKDVDYNGAKYRGVFIKANRVSYGYSNTQKDNGYIKENVYWFKWEPLQWRVLDPSAGFILCATAIDSQPFNNSSSSNYAKSAIRIWLNQDFYNAAFSATEKAAIQTTSLENKSIVSADYDAGTTTDKVFLLSYAEATNNTYGFRSDPETIDLAKLVEGSDYAKCQGLWYCKDIYSEVEGYSCWWLRTPYTPPFACEVDHDGRIFMDDVFHNNFGVCPAMKIQNLNAAGLKSIAVKTMPSKTSYSTGDSFNPSGLTLSATYNGGIVKTVTSGFTCTGFSSSTAGTKTITVTYEGKTTTFTVTVSNAPVTLTGIAVKTMPTKVSYTVGESFNSSGLTLTASYSNSTTQTITSGFTCTGFSSAAPGICTITVKYGGKTTTFDVTINPAPVTLSSIAVKTLPTKTTYILGESFNQSGLTLTAIYSDNSKETITEGFTCTGFDSSTPGSKTITVTYKGKTTTFNVSVTDNSKASVNIRNFTASKTVDYKATVTFTAEVKNAVSGAAVHWFIDGKDEGTGDTYTVSKAKKSYTVQVKYMKDGNVIAESQVETVNVKTGFFAKLTAFFRSIFGKLPKIVQSFPGVEIIDRVVK